MTNKATNADLKLNTKRLYAADSSAIKELSKLVSLFKREEVCSREFNPDIKGLRDLATELTTNGAILHELLGKEAEIRNIRFKAVSKQIDLGELELFIQQQHEQVEQEQQNVESALVQLKSDSKHLSSKIEKREMELQRRKKRLKSLQEVRPAYMDEFERLEVDLKKIYKMYVDRSRNLSFLEQQAEDFARLEQHKTEEHEMTMKRMQEKLKTDDLKLLQGEEHEISRPKGARSGKRQVDLNDEFSSMESEYESESSNEWRPTEIEDSQSLESFVSDF